jgi:hypothetical protein
LNGMKTSPAPTWGPAPWPCSTRPTNGNEKLPDFMGMLIRKYSCKII